MKNWCVWTLAFLFGVSVLRADDKAKSIVRLTVTSVRPDYKAPWNAGNVERGIGSGFIISGNRILTNAHVVSNARYITVERDGDPKKYRGKVVAIADDCDLALLDVTDSAFYKNTAPLEFGAIPAEESTVWAYGYPIGGEHLSVTAGVVSRVDYQVYTHTYLDAHLAIQISAQINPGNSGGPVMQNGKVVGVAFQGYSGDVAQGVAYMIPTVVIERFLKDIADGDYYGYLELGVTYSKLQNLAQRRFLGLSNDNRGVLVASVTKAGEASGHVKSGDVLIALDDDPIYADGTVELGNHIVELSEVIERKQKGESVKLDILRDGKRLSIELQLGKIWPYSIQGRRYNSKPRYVVYDGLVFQPLSLDLMEAYQPTDLRLRHLFEYFVADEIYLDHPEVIVLMNILADPSNTHFGPYRYRIVDEINGKKIKTLADLATAFSQTPERFVVRMIGEDGPPLVIDRQSAELARARITARYGIASEQNLRE